MKNLFKIALIAAGPFVISPVFAQTHKDTTFGQKISKTAKKVSHTTKTTAVKVGHKTSQIAANSESTIVDKKYNGKVAPGNHNVYIDKNSKYYYVNKKGHRVYVKESQLINKPAH
ncbi:hypothetical protein [Mucilaginibacter dorajii]|uniref:PBCV-specific basic adaptor domain-containing protein n=1 Tax=Mucilaginibacter dorajii TaxID=692994 RepID=A0ABP7PDE9_9SPHI|nr:hypothetical protein [Mucilaginibacter dorajii]MCS3734656.1 hypothetical protein [Mucilaginibacter dorajii]